MTMKNEQGRSMVEMLGVLAVMGVLSVGGVAMYTNAMNKYRANELLNESSKRAVVIATQILSGKSVSADMMNQFDNNGSTFTGVEAVGTNQFKLTLSGVDDDVCTQLKATVGSNTIIQEVGDKCAFLTFNNDLSKGATSSSTNGGTGGSEQQDVDLSSENISNDSPCSYSDKYVCKGSRIFQCQDGFWKGVDVCEGGCKSFTNSSIEGVCEIFQRGSGAYCSDLGLYHGRGTIYHCESSGNGKYDLNRWVFFGDCLSLGSKESSMILEEVCTEID